MPMYVDFQMCEELHTGYLSNEPWAYRPKWEKIHWMAYKRIKRNVAEYDAGRERLNAIDITLGDWMTSDDRDRQKHIEFAERIDRMKRGG